MHKCDCNTFAAVAMQFSRDWEIAQHIKFIIYSSKKIKWMKGWHAKKYANKVGMMHESNG